MPELLRLTISFPPTEKDLILTALFQRGITSLEEHGEDTILYYVESGEAAESIRSDVEEFLESIGRPLNAVFALTALENPDWVNNWKNYAAPVRIGETLVITHDDRPVESPPGAKLLRIETGLTFGAGTHETTKLCLEMLLEQLKEKPAPSFLDVGCGSGVLSIAAAKLGCPRALGIDIDPEAVRMSQENAARNSADNCIFSVGPLADVTDRFELVCANIISSVLIDLWPELISRTAADGALLVSGLLIEEERRFLQAVGRTPVQICRGEQWLAFVFAGS